MKTDKTSIHLITQNLKARILLEQSLSSNEGIVIYYHPDCENFCNSDFDPEKDAEKIILLIDADPLENLCLDSEKIRTCCSQYEEFILLFSIETINSEILSKSDCDGALKLPFTLDDVLDLANTLSEPPGCREEDVILFIDDSMLIHKMVDTILTPQGYRLEHSYSGSEGLEAAAKLLPDLIITDIQMPGMNGYEVCRKIKEDEKLCRIPVLIQSSLTDGEYIDEGFESGADDYITKPINAAELVSRISSFLNPVTSRRETILVADNSRLIYNMIKTGLNKQGFDCITASTGPEILKLAEKQPVDLFIISQVLSGLEGRDVVRLLRRNPSTKSCPVIMLSSRDSKLDLIKNRSAGVSEFIAKPFSVERMLVAVEKLLAEYRFAKQRDAMSLYISEAALDHADELAQSDTPLSMRAKEEYRTILFTDIVGFTPLCSELPPDQVIELLNSYFDSMVGIIRDNSGTIDKFIGDAIMAVYGGRENGTYLAVKSGIEMITALTEFNKTSIRPINIRIGINSGPVVLGDLGSRHFRRDYTLIGDAVNVAQRLEGAAPPNRILVSAESWSLIEEYFDAEHQEPISLKGKQEKVNTFLIKGLKQEVLSQKPDSGIFNNEAAWYSPFHRRRTLVVHPSFA